MMGRLRYPYIVLVAVALTIGAWGRSPSPPRSALADKSRIMAAEAKTLGVLMAAPGEKVRIPQIASQQLGISIVQTAQLAAPPTRKQIADQLAAFLPCADYVDEVVVLRHPGATDPDDLSFGLEQYMAGVVAVRKLAESQPASRSNVTVKLYLFLPLEILDGIDLDKPVSSSSIIPYANGPLPQNAADFLTWTLAHETWHLLDVQSRLDRIFQPGQHSVEKIDRILADPFLWRSEYQEIAVAETLGWQNFGESYAMSDEMERSFTIQAGQTTFRIGGGAIAITYADGQYAFERHAIRAGYLPEALQNLSDLEPVLKSGRYPTLYSLLNTEEERFAEYGAWYLYADAAGESQRFQALLPELHDRYNERWQTAASQCGVHERLPNER